MLTDEAGIKHIKHTPCLKALKIHLWKQDMCGKRLNNHRRQYVTKCQNECGRRIIRIYKREKLVWTHKKLGQHIIKNG